MLTCLLLIPLLGSAGVLITTDSENSKKLFLQIILTVSVLAIYILNFTNFSLYNAGNFYLQNIEMYLYLFLFGIILSDFIFSFLKLGLLGKNIKYKVKKILKKKRIFNKYFILFVILYFTILINLDFTIIALEPEKFTFKFDTHVFEFSGEGLTKMAEDYGTHFAFLTGLKIGAALASKMKIGLAPKIGGTVVSGISTAVGYTATMDGIGLIKGRLLNNNSTSSNSTDTISVIVDNASLNAEVIESGLSKSSEFGSILTKYLTPKTETISSQISPKITELLKELKLSSAKPELPVDPTLKSKVLKEIGNQSEIFKIFEEGTKVTVESQSTPLNNLSQISTINCPKELPNLDVIVSILTKDLILHSCMLYLVFNIILILSLKLIADKGLYTPYWENKIQSYPLGHSLNKILKIIFNTWKASSIIWIYFMLIILFITLCISTFVIYATLTSFNG